MSYNPYRWCIVPMCKSTSVKTPKKLFIRVPDNIKMRNIWLKLARRDPKSLSIKSGLYLCEDHFNLEHDMENYMEYKIMGSVKRIRMKPNIIPSRLDCHRKHMSSSYTRSVFIKKQRRDLIKEAENTLKEKVCAIPSASSCKPDLPTVEKVLLHDECKADKVVQVQIQQTKEYKPVQANISTQCRSKATQINVKVKDNITSPIKTSMSIATSLMKVAPSDMPSASGVMRPTKRKSTLIFEETSDGEASYTPSIPGSICQDFLPHKLETTSDSTLPEELQKEDRNSYLQYTISNINLV